MPRPALVPMRTTTLCALLLLAAGCTSHRHGPTPSPAPAAAPAPAGSASLSGVVLDGQGAPLPGATVVASSPNLLGGSRSTTTNADGRYRFPFLPSGSYQLEAELFGFKKFEAQGLRILSGQPITFSPVLTVEGVEVAIEVRAHEDIVQPEKTQVSTALNSTFLGNASGGGRSRPFHARNRSSTVVVVAETPSSLGTFGTDFNQSAAPVVTDGPLAAADPSMAGLRAVDETGEPTRSLPLEHTYVEAQVSGSLAQTEVRQVFHNPSSEVIEAIYTFPLPSDAAVHDFLMEVGDRTIIGIIRPREEAERIYTEARAAGMTASLLTQERPNVFNQSVANIEPEGRVEVIVTYFHQLPYEEGRFEYLFPMVVGPRYIPGQPLAPGRSDASVRATGGGVNPDTDQVPDASHISPPVPPPSANSGNHVSLTLNLEAGMPIQAIDCPTHRIEVTRGGPTRATVALASDDNVANRDFVLRYGVAAEQLRLGIVAHRSPEQGGFFAAMVVPQLDPSDRDVSPREVTFVLDTSGSMSGIPIEISKEIVTRSLKALRPEDRFNVIRFSGDTGLLSPSPLPNTPENVKRGLKFVRAMSGQGGTEMLSGLRAYLDTPRDPGWVRIVCFLTDGYVGNDAAILSIIENRGQDARWFSFGIGSSVNRYLIEGIAEHGHGEAHVVLPRERDQARRAADRFLTRIDAPVLVDVEVDPGDLPLTDLEPEKLPDLFSSQPVRLTGRYTGPAHGTLTIRGRVGNRVVEIPLEVDLPALEPSHPQLAPVWARHRVARLMKAMLAANGEQDLRARITDLALEFRLMSPFTSFVAVDESRAVGDGRPVRVLQPVELPESVSFEGAVGASLVGRPVRMERWGITLQENTDGSLQVLQVDASGPAASHGLRPGDRVSTLDRTRIRGLRHLESLLLQASSPQLQVGLRSSPDGPLTEVTLSRP